MGCIKSKKKENEEEEKKKAIQEDKNFGPDSELLRNENALYQEIDQIFHIFDKDNDHSLDKDEFQAALAEVHSRMVKNKQDTEKLENFIEQMDIPSTKRFTKEEFRIILSAIILEEFTLNEIIDLFKTFDKNKDGKIDKDELMHMLKHLGMTIDSGMAEDLIREASFSGVTDAIDFEEFCRVILAK